MNNEMQSIEEALDAFKDDHEYQIRFLKDIILSQIEDHEAAIDILKRDYEDRRKEFIKNGTADGKVHILRNPYSEYLKHINHNLGVSNEY